MGNIVGKCVVIQTPRNNYKLVKLLGEMGEKAEEASFALVELQGNDNIKLSEAASNSLVTIQQKSAEARKKREEEQALKDKESVNFQ